MIRIGRVDSARRTAYLISRPALLGILVDGLPAGTVRFGEAAPDLGTLAGFDVVVAADGTRSATRDVLFGSRYRPVYTGMTAWRGWIPGETASVTETWGPGALFGISRAGSWIGRHGAARTALVTGGIYALLIALLTHMPAYAGLLALLAVFGLVTSVFDVAINTEASQLERLAGRPLMSGMHGMFSLGGMAGAVSGGAALAAGWAPAWHLVLVAGVMAVAVVAAARRMLPAEATAQEAEGGFHLPAGSR